MSARVAYDFRLLSVERCGGMSARLGVLILGQNNLGTDDESWVPLTCSRFSVSGGYTPDINGTLIVDPITATMALSSWAPIGNVLLPADRIRARYNGEIIFDGIVDTINLDSEYHPGARRRGGYRRDTYAATAIQNPWIAMCRVVTYPEMPEEPAITQVQRFVTVTGWAG